MNTPPAAGAIDDAKELLAALQRDIAARLRSVRGGLTDQSFDQLVREIAAFKLKHETVDGLSASLRFQLARLMTEPDPQSLMSAD